MAFQLGITDFIVISAMLVISAAIGLIFRFIGGRQKTTEEFLMAGRNMGILPVAFSLMATNVSPISVLGIPVETYLFGSQFLLMIAIMPIGAAIAAYGCVPVFFDMGVSTSYEYLEKRFGKTTRSIVAFFFALQMMIITAVVLYAPALALNAVTGLSTWTSILSLSLVCIFYCTTGGLKAILWTDVFQALLIYVTVLAIIVEASVTLGVADIFSIAAEGGRIEFFNISADPTTRYTLWNTVLSGILYSFYTFGTNQSTIQRMISVGSIVKAQKAILWSLPLIIVINILTIVDGIVLYGMYRDCDPMKDPSVRLFSPDQMVPFTLLKLFGDVPGLTGLCIAGIFSASLSTVSSTINALTTVVMEDFMRPFCFAKCLREPWMTVVAKVVLLAVGGVILLLTYVVARFRGILEASYVVNGIVAGPVVGVYSLGFFTKTSNEKGTLIGLIVGIALNAWLGFGSYAVKPKVQTLARSIVGCSGFNGTTLLQTVGRVPRLASKEEEEYIFPMYRVSFLWFPILGAVAVVLVGYISSLLLSFCTDVPEVNPEKLSPFVRKLLYKPVQDTKNEMLDNNAKQKPEDTAL